jgi:hypothetical protein
MNVTEFQLGRESRYMVLFDREHPCADAVARSPGWLREVKRRASSALTMRVIQWLRKPAAEFIHSASNRRRAVKPH